ncbi:PAS domain-containing protein [Clostridium niameyense]|uniref:histidine kinase n=1 Tax=Clostridium niameyense TaxID=1622073 RepID=A0A6M0R6M9_9CLOT|nr:PAS domain-containing sensor histidine kinase [Clostridium niameyense]NEZ45841.1 PAS domain-containing protein [Clostridium niameyense]
MERNKDFLLENIDIVLTKVMDAIPYFSYIIDSKGNILYINKKGKMILNDINEKWYVNIFDYIKEKKVYFMNNERVTKDNFPVLKTLREKKEVKECLLIVEEWKNETAYLKLSSTPLEEKGKFIGSLISLIDVTEEYISRKNIERDKEKLLDISNELKNKCSLIEVLRKKELKHIKYLRDIINNVSEGVIVFDSRGNLSLYNKSLREILDIQTNEINIPEKILYKYKIYRIDECGESEREIKSVNINFRKSVINNILKLVNKKDNSIKYIQYGQIPVMGKKNKIEYTIGTIKDITNLKKHQIKLEGGVNFIKNVVDYLEVPIAVLEYPSLTYSLVNKKYEEVVGKFYNRQLHNILINKHILEIFTEEEFKEQLYILNNVIEKEQSGYTFPPKKLIDDMGEERFYKFKYIYHKNPKNIERIYIHGADITEELKNNMELKKITKLKDEFFTVVSHELRTPLTIIYSSLQLAYDIYNKEITPNIDKILKRINQNEARLLKLINNILDISKAEAGFLTLDNSKFDIVHETENMVNSVISYADMKNINLIFDTSEEEAEVILDKEKYERILLNLLSNAIKFTPKNKSIYVKLVIYKDNFKLIVQDEGIGIPEDKIYAIFDRFIQINSSLSRCAEGTGIGLALVKKIVECMHGKIRVYSNIEKGTIFEVYLKRSLKDCNKINKNTVIQNDIKSKINIEFSDIN